MNKGRSEITKTFHKEKEGIKNKPRVPEFGAGLHLQMFVVERWSDSRCPTYLVLE